MQKDKATKSKAKKPTPKAQSVQETGKHEKVVQDRIAGLTIGELMKRHSYSRQAVRDIINANKDRINEAIAAHLEDRQERIYKALDDDTENLAELVKGTTTLLRKMIGRINDRLAEDTPLKDKDLAAFADVAVKAVDRIHTIVLNRQKETARDQ